MAHRCNEEAKRCKPLSTIQHMIDRKWKIEILIYVAFRDVHHFRQLRRCIGNVSESIFQVTQRAGGGWISCKHGFRRDISAR